MAIRMIVTDMDGTLLDPLNRIPKENKMALQEAAARGIHVVIATGRMHRSALPLAKELAIEVPILSCNGALLKMATGEDIFSSCIDPKMVCAMLDCMKERGWYVQLYSGERLLFAEYDDRSAAYEKAAGIKGEVVGWDGLYKNSDKINKMLSITADEDETDDRTGELSKEFLGKLKVVRSKDIYIDIMASDVSKAAGIRRLAAMYSIAMKEVLALGDSDNDSEMLAAAGIGVAMTTGTKGAKEAADFLADNKTATGVANAVRSYALGGEDI